LNKLTVQVVRPTDWPRVEALFGANGACGGCWCMWARLPRGGKPWEASKGEPNKQALRELVERGRVHAVLASDGGRTVGWCCLGPRADFPRLERVKAARSDWDASTWSVVCFFIPAAERGKGVASTLLDAAIEFARECGARRIEGYPVHSGDDSKLPAAFAWTGVAAMFEARGFERLSPRGARELWTLELGAGRAKPTRARKIRARTRKA
jgi:GNAT superfamily N-acetyltransferase